MKCNRPWIPLIPPRDRGPLAIGRSAICFSAICLLAFGFLAGCPWSPGKNPVIPPQPSNYLPQTSPANVMANLQTAYGDRNIAEYRKLFTDDFTFVFNPLDPSDPDHPNPASWGLVDEMQATENMFKDELVTKIELSSYSLGVPEPVDSLTYGPRAWKVRVDQANLQVATRTPENELLTLVVDGTTEMFFFREEPTKPVGGRPTWYIFRWEDQPITSKSPPVAASGKPDA